MHNNVEKILQKADEISKLVPEANVVYAHGRMTGNQIEEIMQEFENFKDTIIKKFIDRITKELEEVNKQVGVIKTSADKIMESSRKIVDNYLKDSKDKIENYNIGKIDKKIKKIEETGTRVRA